VTEGSGSDRPEALDEEFRAALFEIDEYLDGMPPEQLGGLVLPLATRWALPRAGFDLLRLREEADTLVQATPLSERILSGYVDQVAWWVSQRMLLDDADEPDLETAEARLAAVRDVIEQRAATVEAAGFTRVAEGSGLRWRRPPGASPRRISSGARWRSGLQSRFFPSCGAPPARGPA
jgi:hypothetical protein